VIFACLGLKFLANSQHKWFGQSKRKGGKNFWFDISGYEGHDPWHTRYQTVKAQAFIRSNEKLNYEVFTIKNRIDDW
jgi:hypothetical protein